VQGGLWAVEQLQVGQVQGVKLSLVQADAVTTQEFRGVHVRRVRPRAARSGRRPR
jgi:hypothetical protein